MSYSSKLSLAAVLLLGSLGFAVAQGTGGAAGGGAGGGASGGAAAGADPGGGASAGAAAGSAAGSAGAQDSAGTAEQRQMPQSDARPSVGRNAERSTSGGVAGSVGTTPMVDRPVGLPSR